MNSSSFNSISELNDYKRTLNLSSDTVLIQYLHSIHSNLLEREGNIQEKSFYQRKLTGDFSNTTSLRKSLLQNRGLLSKLNSENGISLKTFLEYMNLQELIGERLFKYFNKSKSNALNKSELIFLN